MNRNASKFLSATLVILMLVPSSVMACGPFSMSAIFTFTVHPEFPLEKYSAGQIGVFQPSYARSYLYVAYRYLNSGRFSESEQKALVALWNERLNLRYDPTEHDGQELWQNARKQVPGLSATPRIDVYRYREKPDQYESYLNCQKDSFETAAETLAAKIKQSAADSDDVKQWVAAQDVVFSNCGSGKNIPEALPANASASVQADRKYQIAAANFYAANFDEAEKLFGEIAADRNSQWRITAHYLAARSLLRKASLGPAETKSAVLTEAERRLTQILNDRSLQAVHEDSARLLNLARLRLRPEDKLRELGVRLVDQGQNPGLKQDLWDYTLLLDSYDSEDENAPLRKPERPDDLTDWIMTFQSNTPDATEHSLQKWQATKSIAWLSAAISKVGGDHAKASLLARAAGELNPASPAFPLVSFHTVRLDIEAGRNAEARAKLDELLRRHQSHFDVSSINLIRYERMLASQSLTEFLNYAQRVPAGLSWDTDGREIPADPEEVSDEAKPLQNKPQFDDDAVDIFNRRMPVALLKQAADGDLPEHLKRDLIQAAWLRAVLLDQHATATALVPKLKKLVPEMAPLLDDYLSKNQPDAKKFSALFAWLRFPGMEPVVDVGLGRGIALQEQDSYRDNWWCGSSFSAEQSQKTDSRPKLLPAFLTSAQLAAADRESAMLKALGAGPNYLARQVIAWANRNPADPRVPEALHLAVKSTRYGCTDKETGRWSKAAHDLLHRRYPRSDWAKRTPYWFKN